MRVIIQRVVSASVEVEGSIVGSIGKGMMVLVGVEDADTIGDVQWLSSKLTQLRIFNDEAGVMNVSVKDIAGEILLVSQFTLHASTKKGNRPSYIKAARPETAIPLYEQFKQQLEMDLGRSIAAGIFGADMQVSLINDGPVTIFIDTKNKE
jgi:D-tyrosyl-tRNA(Tyr) deacylase